MEAKELRVGNLIIKDRIDGGSIIEEVTSSDIMVLDTIGIDWFHPIPLTEEWEDKCGIEHKTIMGNSHTTRFIDKMGVPDWVVTVHDLQNWYYYKFAKKELTIK